MHSVQNILPACVVKMFVSECRKTQKLVYYLLGTAKPISMDEQLSNSTYFEIFCQIVLSLIIFILNILQRARPTLWVHCVFLLKCASVAPGPQPQNIFLDLINALRLASLGIFNFLSQPWHFNFFSFIKLSEGHKQRP